ncbi:hypothetical protein JAAARDRAFT_178741 [Jaapia argillacea MUCL 33604]|uniref:XLF-like N-terminal domain-containing protein n=1 Tax=Jaapia argillacea MUCL 33604 TaxID=933084 RepID=A0A067Q3J6_9AGAM|nr:hypothetical protein JAAARDRAFT_178741 [Jaapia argillacea MUCL 33604]
MEQFSEEHSKLLLAKEWLVKIDSEKSIPYLFKFHMSTVDLSGCLLITDTKTVWTEVLSIKQFARRWRACNSDSPATFSEPGEEDSWRSQHLELLSSMHSLGGIVDTSFEVFESKNSDFAFHLDGETFKWRWETYREGPKTSADLLSKHLIMPLISVTHLAFSSADPVCELSEGDLEKAVDKVGRTARRTTDTHIKHAISKPRVATALRRMTAMFNFIPDLPGIATEVEKPDLSLPEAWTRDLRTKPTASLSERSRPPSAHSAKRQSPAAASGSTDIKLPSPQPDSSTESEDDASPLPIFQSKGKEKNTSLLSPSPPPVRSTRSPTNERGSRGVSPSLMILPTESQSKGPVAPSSDTDSSPIRPPAKKQKPTVQSESEEDSEAERKRRVANIRGGKGGVRQPIKRGGKRF